ncbi:MAG: DNA-processing protein DprA, partial [Proteobacteria bacterium]|nr:DNA-processing protein DprA [Pseudomonadota bacterium]
CFVATVNDDGSPNLSPKSSLRVHDDRHLLFANIASPGTVANLRRDPRIEINCVDVFARRGYRFTGRATLHTEGDRLFSDLAADVKAEHGDPIPVYDAVLVEVQRALPLLSPAYPPRLAARPDAPVLLHAIGDGSRLVAAQVAVVGARAATAYGLERAGQLARELSAVGVVVVSGLARGIDAAAHRGALAGPAGTIAVVASGPDQVYPPEHAELARAIAGNGCVVSEFPVGAPPLRHHFPVRNRVISGLARAVVVIEARERSGSLITARHAADQGVDVLALPGPVTAPTSAGPNRLIRDGARPLLETQDVLEELGWPRAEPAAATAESATTGLTRSILTHLRHEALTRDELATRLAEELEVAAGQVALALVELELSGRVVEDRDGRLRVWGNKS